MGFFGKLLFVCSCVFFEGGFLFWRCYICSVLINVYGKVELLEKMDFMYVMMCVKGVFFNEYIYSVLIDGYGKLGMVGKVEVVLDEMFKVGIKMNVVVYMFIINVYGSVKRF